MTLQEVRSPEHSTAGLEVTRLDRTSWCISNSFINEGDSGRLLGYIEGLERDRYEVLWIAAPISWAYVNSFELALAALADRLQFSGIVEPERDPAARASSIALFHPVRRR